MVKTNHDNSQPDSIPERIILDSSTGEVHPELAQLLQNLEKAQGDTLSKVVTGLRGYPVSGFSFKVYLAPKHTTSGTTYELRVNFEYNATVKQGVNLKRVYSAYMDADPDREQLTMEFPPVAKPGK